MLSYAEIAPQPTLWLWRNRVPLGDVTLLFGAGAIGKGRMLCSIIAAVTRGWPVGTDTEGSEPGDVIVIFPEDKPDEQVVKRLQAAGADLARVHDMTKLDSGSRFKLSASEKHPGHLAHLRGAIEELRGQGRNPRLVIIDPLAAVVGWGSIATNPGARHLIEPLQDMADVTGVAVLVVAHTTKAGVLQGSAGLQQALRTVYRVAVDPANDAHRIVTVEKANNLPAMDDLRFTIAGDGTGTPRVVWLDRAELDKQRQSWRDRLTARNASPPGQARTHRAPGLTYAAALAVASPAGGKPATYSLGSHGSLSAAQAACQGAPQAASHVLTWRPKDKTTWVATAPGASFGVSIGTK